MEDGLVEVESGVHAWIQPDGTWWVNNAGAIHDGADVLLVDTCATRRRTERFLTSVATVTVGASVRWAALTHLHGDHAYGAALLPGSVTVLAHTLTREALAADEILAATPPVWSPVPDWGVDRVRLPDVVFDDGLVVQVGRLQVELRHPGFTAHTRGDVVGWVPERRVLFAGDLLSNGVTPMMLAGSVDGALRALDWVAAYEPTTAVPGHGPLIGAAELDDVLAALARYFRFVLGHARRGLAEDLSPLEVAAECELGEFADWGDPERLVLNLHRAYADLTGTSVDVDAARADVVAWNGGPLRCTV